MKKFPIVLQAIAILLWAACSFLGIPTSDVVVNLIEKSPNVIWLSVDQRIWKGYWGAEGWVGSTYRTYWVKLVGVGPTFTDPIFQDDPHNMRCIGTIALDREHNHVTISMQRVVDQGNRTMPHPSNGIHTIHSVRKAQPNETWFTD